MMMMMMGHSRAASPTAAALIASLCLCLLAGGPAAVAGRLLQQAPASASCPSLGYVTGSNLACDVAPAVVFESGKTADDCTTECSCDVSCVAFTSFTSGACSLFYSCPSTTAISGVTSGAKITADGDANTSAGLSMDESEDQSEEESAVPETNPSEQQEETSPAAEESSAENADSSEEEEASAAEANSTADEEESSGDEEESSADEEESSADKEESSADKEESSADKEESSADEESSGDEEESSGDEEESSEGDEESSEDSSPAEESSDGSSPAEEESSEGLELIVDTEEDGDADLTIAGVAVRTVDDPEFTYIPKYRCQGTVFDQQWVTDSNSCEAACASSPTCGAFVLRPFAAGATCELLLSCDGLVANPNYYVGLKTGAPAAAVAAAAAVTTPSSYLYYDTYACSGPVLSQLWVQDFLTCQQACNGNSMCTGFTYRAFQFSASCKLTSDCTSITSAPNQIAAQRT